MRNEFTAIVQETESWFVAFAPEVPAANGQGRTREEALQSLISAIELVLEDLREDAMAELPPGAERTTIAIA